MFASPSKNGFTIATQPRRTPPRTQPTTSARRAAASAGRAAAARQQSAPRRPAARSRASAVPPYRPNYWLVAALAIAVVLLAITFLVTIAILWSLSGALTTTVMVLVYAVVMFVLWRVGISRL